MVGDVPACVDGIATPTYQDVRSWISTDTRRYLLERFWIWPSCLHPHLVFIGSGQSLVSLGVLGIRPQVSSWGLVARSSDLRASRVGRAPTPSLTRVSSQPSPTPRTEPPQGRKSTYCRVRAPFDLEGFKEVSIPCQSPTIARERVSKGLPT